MSLSGAERLSGTSMFGWSWHASRVLAFAFRELRAGVGGFAIFIACIALGVAVIVGRRSPDRCAAQRV